MVVLRGVVMVLTIVAFGLLGKLGLVDVVLAFRHRVVLGLHGLHSRRRRRRLWHELVARLVQHARLAEMMMMIFRQHRKNGECRVRERVSVSRCARLRRSRAFWSLRRSLSALSALRCVLPVSHSRCTLQTPQTRCTSEIPLDTRLFKMAARSRLQFTVIDTAGHRHSFQSKSFKALSQLAQLATIRYDTHLDHF